MIPAASFRAGGDEARTFLNSIKYNCTAIKKIGLHVMIDMHALHGTLQTKAEAERTEAEAENSRAAVAALLEQSKLLEDQREGSINEGPRTMPNGLHILRALGRLASRQCP